MIYQYPRPQSIFENTIFLMKETVDSGKFTEYNIPFNKNDAVYIKNISHEMLLKLIERGIVKKFAKEGAFNDKPYYRIPLNIQLTLF